ncbi:MAG: hypothetical protein HYU75_21160 [Betaproteobacteria bacterium]|nr:hypothetical protein [Betaproteobacteria bacterium]
MTQSKLQSRQVTTACGMCYIGCGIQVEVRDGVVVGIEGNPANPQNRGAMCAKGKAGFMNLYNPNRVKTPLKRTNPKKGIGVEPGWGHFGHWSSGTPISRGKGVNFNGLCPNELERIDKISTALDHCVEVKVYK